MMWSSVGSFAFQVIRTVTQILLARLLWPEAFGLFAIVTSFISIAQYLIENGLTMFLIRKPDLRKSDSSTLFYANLVFSILIFTGFFLMAPVLGAYFNESNLEWMLRASSIALILNALSSVHRAHLTREIQFRGQAIINLVSATSSGIIAILLASMGFGIWSLVLYNILYQLIQSVLLMSIHRFLPESSFDWKFFKEALIYSWKLMLSGLLNTLYENIFNVVLAGVYSVSSLGFYSNALKIRDGAAQTLTDSIQKVSFPVLSKMQDEKDRLKSNTKRIMKASLFIIFPLLIGLAATSENIIMVIFGEKWLGMIPFIQVLAINGLLIPLHKVNLNVLSVIGRTDVYLKLEIIKKVIALLTLSFAFLSGWDILSVLWILFFNALLGYIVNSWYTGKFIDYPMFEQMIDIRFIALGSLVMGVIVTLIPYLVSTGNLVTLSIQILIGALVYIIYSYFFLPNEFKLVMDILKSIKSKLVRNK